MPYTHNVANTDGGCFTISKSGAYSGYIWWHETPIWASDCIVVRSQNEHEFLSFYLYLCMKAKQQEIYSRQQGTGQPHVYSSHVEDFWIPRLPLEEQDQCVRSVRRALSLRLAAEEEESSSEAEAVSKLRKVYKGRTVRMTKPRRKVVYTEGTRSVDMQEVLADEDVQRTLQAAISTFHGMGTKRGGGRN